MRMWKKSMVVVVALLLCFNVVGCVEDRSSSTADEDMQKKTEQSMKEANSQIGMPAIENFQEKKLAKMIFELRDQEDLITYAYLVNLNGDLIFIGKCIGFGLPYSVQYTSPQKLVDVEDYGISSYQSNDSAIIPQADPNGLFMPDGLSATWLMMIDPKTNEPRPVYVEPQIIVSPFPLHK